MKQLLHVAAAAAGTFRGTVLLGVALACTGCYRYTPTEVGAVRPGEHVRTHLTATEADRLAQSLGDVVRRLDGVVVESNGATLLVEVPVAARPASGGLPVRLNQQVAVARDGVLRIDSRQLDRTRTGVVVAAGAGAVGVVLVAWVSGARGQDRPGEFEVPEARRSFTLLRLPW